MVQMSVSRFYIAKTGNYLFELLLKMSSHAYNIYNLSHGRPTSLLTVLL